MADFNSKKEYRCIEMDSGNESKCYNFNDSTEICGIWCSFCTFCISQNYSWLKSLVSVWEKKVIEVTVKLYRRG